MPYTDPENIDSIVESIKNSSNHTECVDLINKTFPGWIVGWPKKFCVDYPQFRNNWEFVCKKIGCNPLCVVIVDFVPSEDGKNYTLLKMFTELLTIFGHSVRRNNEFVGCAVCGDAIPSDAIYADLKARKMQCPKFWTIRCSTC
jgi:hypothetical protein